MKTANPGRGFSLIELMAVIAIILIISAISIPAIGRGLATYRLGSSANELTGLIGRARYEALRMNNTMRCRVEFVQGGWQVYIDRNDDGNWQDTEPMVRLPGQVQLVGEGEAPSSASMGLGAVTEMAEGSVLAFNGRGTVEFGADPNTFYAFYLAYAGRPEIGYRAVVLAPVGRARVWRATEEGEWHAL